MITVDEAAERLGLTKWGVFKYLREGRLKAQKKSGVWDIDPRSLKALASRDRKPGPKPR